MAGGIYGLVAVWCLMTSSVTWSLSPYDASLYEDMLFQDLYKRLSQLEDTYYPLEEDPYGSQAIWDEGEIAVDSRDNGQTDIRDPEYIAHSSNSDGFQYISGGAGEGKQHLTPDGTQENTQEVKSDDILPFYCQPPNPCPKGFTADDGCQEEVEDSAEVQKEWISSMQRKGLCSCDTEHMFDCPRGSAPGDNGDAVNAQDAMLDKMIDSLLGNDEPGNPFSGGNKHEKLVAKKSPRIKRSTEDLEAQLAGVQQRKRSAANPYLQGPKLHIVAKKGLQYS